ncbi:hypothetical protein AVEN_247954-1 [Araneus ventricosus]|uniref:RNase H type-1 domain-containing protein n=1 Tax=Araneus ventricosus TaxID=182803 RepID=A0A4Y2CLA9_ARAVE|nr:hypothetical protein AVEN_247954-1 [Araneus ventricosus]
MYIIQRKYLSFLENSLHFSTQKTITVEPQLTELYFVGYLGNECADQLAKEAITKSDPFLLPKPLSYLKSGIKSATLSIWQDKWDNGETGRSTHYIVPRVFNKPVGWNREEIMFVTGHGPFPSYLQSSNT